MQAFNSMNVHREKDEPVSEKRQTKAIKTYTLALCQACFFCKITMRKKVNVEVLSEIVL